MEKITHKIYGDSPGKQTELVCFKLGSEQAGRKVYLQAALHADEQPGILVLHHLLKLLKQAEEQGLLTAQFVVFPMVNPLGMGDIGFRQHQGRYDRASGVNFNRNWPDLFKAVGTQVAAQLTDNAQQNIQIVRSALKAWLAKQQPITALQQQRHIVLQAAFDADFVLDLHCDNEALPHIFTVPQSAAVMQDLSDWMGAAATLFAEDSGGYSFDEVWSTLWLDLAKAYPDKPLPLACHSATLEYRGQFDTFDELNQDDAERLYAFLQSQGLIGGDLIRSRPSVTPTGTDLAATEMTRVQQAGLLAYKVQLGDVVKKGDVLADLIALDGEGALMERIPVLAGTDGVIISRNINKYVWPGCSVAKIVGKEKLEARGEYLLED
ncbi:succinylglutamate desuccinylase/aspartoacylase family protein [uncultured Thiothrix sp.]|uniref:succinylglutamate desuccinylase/aspartoacylase family protein n=1 Tax=uncultured Thiothrix sp. TaxID=223185 RepID=UPI002628FED8|nr:succinylglutamate desuccinylase/aspartoacylase family protein [uncultured Thiothrix sp.]